MNMSGTTTIFSALRRITCCRPVSARAIFSRDQASAPLQWLTRAQQFFADGNETITVYRRDVGFDVHGYSYDAGVNWHAPTNCQGKLVAAASQTQTPQEQLLAPGVDIVRAISANETGQCTLFQQNYSIIFNGGLTSQTHSLFLARALDSNTATAQGGLQYQWAGLNQLQLLVGYTDTHYINAASYAPESGGLVQYYRQISYQILYNRTISDKLDFLAMAGLVETPSLSGNANRMNFLPSYSLTLNWRPSQKWSLSLATSHTVSQPYSVIANAQVSTTQSASISYNWTPKFSILGSLTASELGGSPALVANGADQTPVYLNYGASNVFSASLAASYQWTPFTSATISVQRSDRTFDSQHITSDLVMMGLDYRPY